MSKFQQNKKRCPAMIEAKITDSESKEGIELCLSCPYEYCVIFEELENPAERRARGKRIVAKMLHERGVTVEDIALLLGVSKAIAYSYIRSKK